MEYSHIVVNKKYLSTVLWLFDNSLPQPKVLKNEGHVRRTIQDLVLQTGCKGVKITKETFASTMNAPCCIDNLFSLDNVELSLVY